MRYNKPLYFILSLTLILPLGSAYAESFTVTTNKDLYTLGEKAIVVGIIPESAPEGYAVLLKVNGPDASVCAVQNILPDSDMSFVSRPLDLEDCGAGLYSVIAFYADLSTNSTFTVSNSSQISAGNRMELKLLKNVAIQAQAAVNQRLREYLELHQVLPEDIADRYSQGVFEASLVLQALDFGNTAEAKKHLIFTIKDFRDVIDSLSAERVLFDQALQLDTASDGSGEALLERYQRLKEFYFRLEELAQKNGIDNENEFGQIVSLLARSQLMIEEGNLEDATDNLEKINEMLESVRMNLYGGSADAYGNNSTGNADVQARRLVSAADRFEKKAYAILEENPGSAVNATIQDALALILQARLDIEMGDYSAARSNLTAAYTALDEASEMMEGDSNHSRENRDSGSGTDSPSEEKEGKGQDQNENGGSDSGSGSDDEDNP